MQNKGFVITFAILLTLVCCFYLSFSFVTRYYEKQAEEYANGDLNLMSQYLDSISNEKVWLGYTLKQSREKEIGLGLDLKGGMNVILEIDAAAVLRSLANEEDPQFNDAITQASDENRRGSNKDYLTLFVEKYEAIDKNGKLATVFGAKLRDQINPTDNNAQVKSILQNELQSVADNSFNVLRTRIDRFGVVAPNIQKLDRAERILIELPGVKEPERVKKLLQGNANLEFWKTYNFQEIQGYLSAINQRSIEILAANQMRDSLSRTNAAVPDSISETLAQATENASANSGTQRKFTKSLFEYLNGQFGGNATVAMVDYRDTAAINSILYAARDIYPSDLRFAWGFKPMTMDGRETNLYELYSLRGDGTKRGPALDGDAVVNSVADQQPNKGWGVSMQMNSSGAKRWATITGAERGKPIAIVLDGYVYSAPMVNDRIEGGNSSITGNFTVDEAKDLENVLKSGKMRAGVRIVQEDIVGPSLGEEAIQAGFISFILALIVLMAYMCLVYGFIPGMIANGALVLNLFFTMGVLASFHAVMTLPGIAGLVLTLAFAVDANVLIYERTKEELRAGKNVKTAVMDGYKHAFSAIFDANLTSVITSIILIYFGTGPIRGFATTLIIGICASFFTAVFLTRLVYTLAFAKGKLKNLTFTTGLTKNLLLNPAYKFLNMYKKTFAISGAVLVLGVVSIMTIGLNTGIDFTGGRNYIVRFDAPVNTAEMQEALRPELEVDGTNVRVITIGSSNQVRITTNYKVEEDGDAVEQEIRNKLNTALTSYMAPGTNIDNYIQSSQKVGPSIADDLKTAAVTAVIFAIISMGLYILIRFRDVAFSVGTLVAVAHDALVVIFFYSFLYKFMPFSMEIDQTFIAAILTVVGYSINDKVVIFDRVRETRLLYPQRDNYTTINDALNSTLARTVSTTVSTLLVVFIIFILGGDTIRSFSFAMLLGVLVGAYSSVFIATPIAYLMLNRGKKEKK